MNPRRFFEDLAKQKIERLAKELQIKDPLIIYKPNPKFGDLVWDTQKLKIDVPQESVEKLCDENIKFQKSGKFINITSILKNMQGLFSIS